MSEAKFPSGLVLTSVFLSLIIASWQLEIVLLDSEPDEEEFWEFIGPCIFIVYLLFLIRYFVVNEGRKYTVSAFSTSIILSAIAVINYDHQVGGWFWNSDWVMKEALVASIRPAIILILLNEFFGFAERGVNKTASASPKHTTSLVRIGLLASLPLVVINPPFTLGMLILVPILVVFFFLYMASTDTPLTLDSN